MIIRTGLLTAKDNTVPFSFEFDYNTPFAQHEKKEEYSVVWIQGQQFTITENYEQLIKLSDELKCRNQKL